MVKAEEAHKLLFWAGLLAVVLTALINIGIIAIDDYADVVSKIIPAQDIRFSELITFRGIHSPLPAFILSIVSKTAFMLGIVKPIHQLRAVLIVVGVISFLSHSLLGRFFFKGSIQDLKIFFAFVGFHFVAPLFFSRAMVETLSAPFISLAVLFVGFYSETYRRTMLLWSAAFAVLAFQLRYQTMAIAPGIVVFILFQKRFLDCVAYMGFLLIGIVLSGLFEFCLTGEFFGFARPYFEYNFYHSSGHGVTPFYTYILLFLGLGIFPVFILNYKNFKWGIYRRLFPVLFPFVSFLFLHSLIPHKEERFMIPVLTLFFVLLVPLAQYIFSIRWRFYVFTLLNFLLFLTCSFSVPQKSIIFLVEQVAQDPSLQRLIGVNETLVLYPTAYGVRPIPKLEIKGSELNRFNLLCSDAVAIRREYIEKDKDLIENLNLVKEFEPGPLESLLVILNPAQNSRRGAIQLYRKKSCRFVS